MGENREDLSGLSRRPEAQDAPADSSRWTPSTGPSTMMAATPGKRAARTTTMSAGERADAATRPYVGKRMADRTVDAPSTTLSHVLDTDTISAVLAGLEPADHSTSFADEDTEQMPLLRIRPVAAPVASTPGKRRATKHPGRRGPLWRGLPSVPLLVGVTALAVSAGGAITVGGGADPVDAPRGSLAPIASALAGTSGTGSVGAVRGDPTSREAARTAVTPPGTDAAADVVEARAQQRSASLGKLDKQGEAYNADLLKNQWQVPLDSYRLTARFGQYGLWSSYHTGLDFAAPSGTSIHAIANGVVTSTGYDGSYGNKTVITLDDGTELWFCHQSGYAVSVGDTVHGGDLIGYVGSTGNVTGPHVHIEVRPGGGDPIDPYPAFVEHGVTP